MKSNLRSIPILLLAFAVIAASTLDTTARPRASRAGNPLDWGVLLQTDRLHATHAVAEQTRKQRLKGLLLQVRSRVAEGHALAYAKQLAPQLGQDKIIVVNLSGRGLVLPRGLTK